MKLDERNCEILQILHGNSRSSLTYIARKVGLSIDSVNKRIHKMIENKIFAPSIYLKHRYCGFNNVVDVKIKLQELQEIKEHERFIAYLKEHPRVSEVFSLSGEWDLTIVIIAKDAIDQGKVTQEIRSKFGKLINSWSESLTVACHKFESYNFKELFLEKCEVIKDERDRTNSFLERRVRR